MTRALDADSYALTTRGMAAVVLEERICDLAHLPRDISQEVHRELVRAFQGIGVDVTVARCANAAGVPAFALGTLAEPRMGSDRVDDLPAD